MLSESSSIWVQEKDALNNRVRRIYSDISTEKTYSLKNNGGTQGALLQTVTTNADYDIYGNSTQLVVTATGSANTSTKTTANEYYPSDWEKRMGRLYQSTVTNQRNSDAAVTRISRFEYYPESDSKKGLLWKEIVEPGSNAFTTEYDYDDAGNKILVKKICSRKTGRNSRT